MRVVLRCAQGLVLLAGLVIAACSPASPPTPAAPAYSSLLAATEFVVGVNRVPFGLVSRDGDLLESAEVTVRFARVVNGEAQPRATAGAAYRQISGTTPHPHPDGQLHLHVDFRGVYVVDGVRFDEPGIWIAEFDVTVAGRVIPAEPAGLEVRAQPGAVGIGEAAPATRNPTIRDVASFAELSSRGVEGDSLHDWSVAGALAAKRPFVVVFATPQFCVSAMCGPVTDTMAEVAERFAGRAPVIHIEPWDLHVARQEGRLVPSPYMAEWRLPTEPWTFVVGADGRVTARFEGLVTAGEVAAALERALAGA